MRAAAERVANNPSALPLQTCRLIAGRLTRRRNRRLLRRSATPKLHERRRAGPHEAFSESLLIARLRLTMPPRLIGRSLYDFDYLGYL